MSENEDASQQQPATDSCPPATDLEGIEKLCRAGRFQDAMSGAEHLINSLPTHSDPIEKGRIHGALAQIQIELGLYEDARKNSQASFDLLKETGEHRLVAEVQRNFGRVFLELGDLDRSRYFAEDSISSFRRLDDEVGSLASLNILSWTYILSTKWARAIELLEQALEISRRHESYIWTAKSSHNLGTVYKKIGQWSKAREQFLSSLEIYERLGDKHSVCQAHLSLGKLELLRRRWDLARDHLLRCTDIAQEEGYVREICLSHEARGSLSFDQDDFEQAGKHYEQALRIATTIAPESELKIAVSYLLAELKISLGDLDEAVRYASDASETARKNEDRQEQGIALRILARARAAQGKRDVAARHLSESVACLRSIEEKFELGRTLLEAGRMFLEEQREDRGLKSLQYISEAAKLFQDLGAEHYRALALRELARLRGELGNLDQGMEALSEAQELFRNLGEQGELDVCSGLRGRLERSIVLRSLSVDNEYAILQKLNQSSNYLADGVPSPRDLLNILTQWVDASRAFVVFSTASPAEDEGRRVVRTTGGLSEQQVHLALQALEEDQPGLFDLREPFLCTDVPNDRRFGRLYPEGFKIPETMMMVPFRSERGFKFLLYADRIEEGPARGPFLQRDLDFFVSFANLVAISVSEVQRDNHLHFSVAETQKGDAPVSSQQIVTYNKKMFSILDLIEKIKDSKLPILLEGETGTGKELIAKVLHHSSAWRVGRFTTFSCTGLSDEIQEIQLFGGLSGVDQDSSRAPLGALEQAEEGTLFLEGVGEMGPSTQARLLRFLDTGSIALEGDEVERPVKVRLVSAATGRLEEDVRSGKLREDLYYRLNALCISIPPLRERKEDVIPLVKHFQQMFAHEDKKESSGLAPGTLKILLDYAWPGNVRELKNEMRRLVTLTRQGELVKPDSLSERLREFGRKQGEVDDSGSLSSQWKGIDLFHLIADSSRSEPDPVSLAYFVDLCEKIGEQSSFSLRDILEAFERHVLERTLEKFDWVGVKTAEFLKIPEGTLRSKMKKYRIERPRDRH